MEELIPAADANRHFSRLLRRVRDGHSYVVTSHGQPVAKLVPISVAVAGAAAARDALLARLRSQEPINVQWVRDELYDDVT